MKRYIRSSSDAKTYQVICEKSGKNRLGYSQSHRPTILNGSLEDQIEYLKQYYDSWKNYYNRYYGQSLNFDTITSIDKVLSAYRKIDKACKESDPEFFNVRKKYSSKVIDPE